MSRSELNPAFLVYAAEELADASSMSFEQFGIFARLRALAWREHGISSNHAEIARRLGLTPKAFAKNSTIVLEPFREQGARLVLPAYEQQREAQAEKREKAKASANARWRHDANAMRTHNPPHADALPTESSAVVDADAAVVTDADAQESKSEVALSPRSFEEFALNVPQLERLLANTSHPEVWRQEIREILTGQKGSLHATADQLSEAIRDFVDKGFAENNPQIKHFRGFVKTAMSAPPPGTRKSRRRNGPPQYDYSKPTNDAKDIKWCR